MTPSLEILYAGSGWLGIVDMLREKLDARGVRHRIVTRDHARPLADQLGEVEVLLPSNSLVGETELAAAPRLRLVQQPAAGFEGIDLVAARARSLPVCNAPGMNVEAVAEATLLLLLALARRVPLAARAFAARSIGTPIGVQLAGRTLVIVGVGKTGGRVGELARALGMKVAEVTRTSGREELERALGEADFVSLHCPVTPATRGMIDDRAFAAMRPGAFLVNVARGAIVERAALERALESGRLGGVGLDVFWNEPWNPADPLFCRDDVVVLPHVAGSTDEAFDAIAEVVADNVRALLDGAPLRHRIGWEMT